MIAEQWQHYKGISSELLTEIHEQLYRRDFAEAPLAPVELRCGVSVQGAFDVGNQVRLACKDRDTGASFEHETDLVVAATGYRQRQPKFLGPIERLLLRDSLGRFRVRLDHSLELARGTKARIFIANADLHSHGVAAPDLGIAAYRNATILNSITGREVYRIPQRTAFTSFGLPAELPTERIAAWAAARTGALQLGGEP